jgi:hypothetical protein
VARETTTDRMIGLSHADIDGSYTSLNYAVYLESNGLVQVWESGVYRGTFGAYAWGDTFRIERLADGNVVYKKNGTVFYASTVVSTAELHADLSIYTPGATVQQVVLSADGAAAKPVTWVNDFGLKQDYLASQGVTTKLVDVDGDGRADAVLTATDGRLWVRHGQADGTFGAAIAPGLGVDGLNSLRKTSTISQWGDANASSTQLFSGAGYVETSVAETNTFRMIGLSHADIDGNYASIDYGVDLAADGNIYIYESGVYRGLVGYATGDTIRIERQADGHVVYKKNGTVFYTSTSVSTGTLRVDTALYTPGATLQNVMVSTGGAASAVEWVNDYGVAVGTLGVNVTTTLGDINGDGRVDAVQAAPDGRLWALLGQADGSFGDAVALGTGIDALNVLRKTSGVSVWGDAGASSAQSFTGAG